MRQSTAGKGGTGRLQGDGRPSVLAAEVKHPGVFLQQEIKDGSKKQGIGGPTAQLGQAGTGSGQEDGKKVVIRGDPAKGLQGDGLGGFFLHDLAAFQGGFTE